MWKMSLLDARVLMRTLLALWIDAIIKNVKCDSIPLIISAGEGRDVGVARYVCVRIHSRNPAE